MQEKHIFEKNRRIEQPEKLSAEGQLPHQLWRSLKDNSARTAEDTRAEKYNIVILQGLVTESFVNENCNMKEVNRLVPYEIVSYVLP